ncbi:MAG: GAF domain-containing protein [Actinomycetota bacterium]|jgi:GAF domain-containing protein
MSDDGSTMREPSPDPDGHFAVLARAASDLGPAIEPPGYRELLDWIVETVREITGADAASIAVFDPHREMLTFVAASGAAGDQVVGMEMDAGKGIAGWALSSGQSITISDAPSDPRFASDIAAATGYTPSTVFAIPLETDAGAMGVMEILDAPEGRADAHDESRLVSTLARQAAVTIETTRMFRTLGRVIFKAASIAAEEGDLTAALERIAEKARGPAREMAELLDLFSEIGSLGPKERQAATDMLYTFLTYAQGNRE